MFTTPCFIRKNTPELRKSLEELGYIKNSPCYTDNEQNIFAYQYSREPAFDTPHYVIANSFDIPLDGDSSLCGKFIDCGENEDLFLALAALRDDTDEKQWFVMDVEIYVNIPKGTWFKATKTDGGKHIGTQIDPIYCHKATAEEIIEHFKN